MNEQARAILLPIIAHAPILGIVLAALGSLLVVGQAVVAITPSRADDEAWDKLMRIPVLGMVLSVLESFAVIHKNPPQ